MGLGEARRRSNESKRNKVRDRGKEKNIRNFKKVLAILVFNTYSIQIGAVRFDSVPHLGRFFDNYLLRTAFFAL